VAEPTRNFGCTALPGKNVSDGCAVKNGRRAAEVERLAPLRVLSLAWLAGRCI
jgi:hypothetical protein